VNAGANPSDSLAEMQPNGPLALLAQEDAVQWLQRLPDDSVDLVCTDPPYESLEKHRARGTTTRLKMSKASSNAWFSIFPNDRFEALFREIYRVLRNNRHFYLFCDPTTMFIAKPIAESVGFQFWKPLVWDKRKIGMGYHYRARYELILFFEKGKRALHDLSIPDVLSFDRIRAGYPAEKPLNLCKLLVQQSTNPWEWVADPFMGSGSVAKAALSCSRSFLGNDLSPHAVRKTYERIWRHEVGIEEFAYTQMVATPGRPSISK
jgi:site-specific DNA-methyltransferase (adenine-specific)